MSAKKMSVFAGMAVLGLAGIASAANGNSATVLDPFTLQTTTVQSSSPVDNAINAVSNNPSQAAKQHALPVLTAIANRPPRSP